MSDSRTPPKPCQKSHQQVRHHYVLAIAFYPIFNAFISVFVYLLMLVILYQTGRITDDYSRYLSVAHWAFVVALICSIPALFLFYKDKSKHGYHTVFVTGLMISGAWLIYNGLISLSPIILIGWLSALFGTCFYDRFIIRSMKKRLK